MASSDGASQADASGESSSGASDSGSHHDSDAHSDSSSVLDNHLVPPEGQKITVTSRWLPSASMHMWKMLGQVKQLKSLYSSRRGILTLEVQHVFSCCSPPD